MREMIDASQQIFKTVRVWRRAYYVDVDVVKPFCYFRKLAKKCFIMTRYLGGLTIFARSSPICDIYIHTMPDESCINERSRSSTRRMSYPMKTCENLSPKFSCDVRSSMSRRHVAPYHDISECLE